MVAFVAPYHVAWRRPNTVNLSAMRRDPETMDPTLGALVSTICARNLTVLGLDSLALLGWNISESSPRRGRVLRRYFVPARLVVRGHDIRPVENVKDSWLLSTGVDALGIPDQSQLDRMVGSDRIACGGCGAPQPRAQASALRLNAMRYLCASRSQPTDRRESAILESACAHPGKTPALRAGWKPSRHRPPCWTRYRW